jgi:hypothetical protein
METHSLNKTMVNGSVKKYKRVRFKTEKKIIGRKINFSQ